MFAAIPTDPTSYAAMGWLFVCAASIAVGAERILKLLDRFKEKPTPADTYVPIKECRIMHDSQNQRVVTLESGIGKMRDEFREFSDQIFSRINPLSNQITDIAARVDMINQRLVASDLRTDRYRVASDKATEHFREGQHHD